MITFLISRRAGYSIGVLVLLVATWIIVISDDAVGRRTIPLMIQTVPEVPGARFSLNGREFTADGQGLALITVPKANVYRLSVLSNTSNRSESRLHFAVWSDAKQAPARAINLESFTYLEAGFETFRRVSFRFVDRGGVAVDPEHIESIVLSDSAGGSMRLIGPGPHRLALRLPTIQGTSLEMEETHYRIKDVVIDGRDVLPQDVRYSPSDDAQPLIELATPTGATAVERPLWVWIVPLVVAGVLMLALARRFHASVYAKDLAKRLPPWGASELRRLNPRRPKKRRGSISASLALGNAFAKSVRPTQPRDSAASQTEGESPSGSPLPDLQGVPIAMAEVDRLTEAFVAARRRLSTKTDDEVADDEVDGTEAIRLQRELEAEQLRLANLQIQRDQRNVELQAEFSAKDAAQKRLERERRAAVRRRSQAKNAED